MAKTPCSALKTRLGVEERVSLWRNVTGDCASGRAGPMGPSEGPVDRRSSPRTGPFAAGPPTQLSTGGLQSVSQWFICKIINKRANTCNWTGRIAPLARSSRIWCLGLVGSACAYRVLCLPVLHQFYGCSTVGVRVPLKKHVRALDSPRSVISRLVRRWCPFGDYVHHRSSRNPRLP